MPSLNLNSMDTSVETLKTADGTPLKKKTMSGTAKNKLAPWKGRRAGGQGA